MGPLVEQKIGWTYAWRNCGTANSPSYSAFFTNTQVKTNIVYAYDDLKNAISDPNKSSQIPMKVLAQALEQYPTQEEKAAAEKAVA